MPLHQTVRDALPIRLGNRKYNIDLSRFARATVDPIRQGFDTRARRVNRHLIRLAYGSVLVLTGS